ncbi:MAG: dipeptide epimerase [Phycisphaerae bacterium]|nr:dipeptide epimerase [Phycisphaerae bacterium]
MKLRWWRQELLLKHTFTIARSSVATKQTILVELEHDGIVGVGEAIPSNYYGQTVESAEAALDGMVGLLGDDPFRIEAILARCLERFDDQRAAVSAVDGALHDWVGKRLNVPVWRLFGLDPDGAPVSSFTIGIDALDVIESKTADAAEYPILKVKVGTDRDEEILSAVRRVAPDKRIRVDANCGWTAETAPERIRRLSEYQLEFVEQPIPPGDNIAMRSVRQEAGVPLVADESSVRPCDVVPLGGCVDGINIKLCKCGGIREALRMIHLARGCGLKVMLGCMIESSVGIAQAAHLAPLVDWIDLDGHLLIRNDPFEGIGGAGGRLTLTERAGLGVARRNR